MRFFIATLAISGAIATALPATSMSQVAADTLSVRLPRTALKRALAPGWGQMYNRQYVKMTAAYVGFIGTVGGALLVNRRYLRYRHAYLFTARLKDDGSPVFPEYAHAYALLLDDLELAPESTLTDAEIKARRARLQPQFRAQRDQLRRNRDLLYFSTVAWYALTILDAYVSAHLFDFDVDESLAVRARVTPGRFSVQLRW